MKSLTSFLYNFEANLWTGEWTKTQVKVLIITVKVPSTIALAKIRAIESLKLFSKSKKIEGSVFLRIFPRGNVLHIFIGVCSKFESSKIKTQRESCSELNGSTVGYFSVLGACVSRNTRHFSYFSSPRAVLIASFLYFCRWKTSTARRKLEDNKYSLAWSY